MRSGLALAASVVTVVHGLPSVSDYVSRALAYRFSTVRGGGMRKHENQSCAGRCRCSHPAETGALASARHWWAVFGREKSPLSGGVAVIFWRFRHLRELYHLSSLKFGCGGVSFLVFVLRCQQIGPSHSFCCCWGFFASVCSLALQFLPFFLAVFLLFFLVNLWESLGELRWRLVLISASRARARRRGRVYV